MVREATMQVVLTTVRHWATGIALMTPACAMTSGYHGDGEFVDHGPLAQTRYVLDLGPIDLRAERRYVFRIAGLPNERMFAGLRINDLPESDVQERPHHPAVIRLSIVTEDGKPVLSEEGPLDSWMWSHTRGLPNSFYYRTGKQRYVTIGEGVTRPEHIDERFDRGWGSTFVPSPSHSYLVTLEVAKSEPAASGLARLLVSGGGATYP